MRQLLVLRHAKSSWADASLDDWQRPLNERGLRDAPRVGDLLRARSLVPDLIITSDAVRARTTADLVAATAGYTNAITIEPSIYEASPEDLLEVVRTIPDGVGTALLVGHNPGLEALVHLLSGEHQGLATAALVQLALPLERWSDLDRSTPATVMDTWRPADER